MLFCGSLHMNINYYMLTQYFNVKVEIHSSKHIRSLTTNTDTFTASVRCEIALFGHLER